MRLDTLAPKAVPVRAAALARAIQTRDIDAHLALLAQLGRLVDKQRNDCQPVRAREDGDQPAPVGGRADVAEPNGGGGDHCEVERIEQGETFGLHFEASRRVATRVPRPQRVAKGAVGLPGREDNQRQAGARAHVGEEGDLDDAPGPEPQVRRRFRRILRDLKTVDDFSITSFNWAAHLMFFSVSAIIPVHCSPCPALKL